MNRVWELVGTVRATTKTVVVDVDKESLESCSGSPAGRLVSTKTTYDGVVVSVYDAVQVMMG